MICEKCGAEIADGKLYCENCGNEIQIVPNFEPEVEQTIHQSMEQILDDVFEKKKPSKEEEKIRKKRPERHYFVWIILLLFISFVVLGMVFFYMNFTSDYQMRRGNYFLKSQDYQSAIKYYEKAERLDPENAEIALYLASCYEAMDKMAGYEACLTKVIQKETATEMQQELAYTRLAALYLENKEYHKIDNLLKNCQIESVMTIFGGYQSQMPVFSHEEGEYEEIIPLKIKAGENGIIYYTTDGQDPTVASSVYSGPIFLKRGEYTIKAIYVNEFGVISPILTGKFKIKF